MVYDYDNPGHAAAQQLSPDLVHGIGDPRTQCWMAGLEDRSVVEFGREEGGSRVEVSEGQDSVGVGSQEVEEMGEVVQVGRGHGSRNTVCGVLGGVLSPQEACQAVQKWCSCGRWKVLGIMSRVFTRVSGICRVDGEWCGLGSSSGVG